MRSPDLRVCFCTKLTDPDLAFFGHDGVLHATMERHAATDAGVPPGDVGEQGQVGSGLPDIADGDRLAAKDQVFATFVHAQQANAPSRPWARARLCFMS